MIAFCPAGHEVTVDFDQANQFGELPCYACRRWFDPAAELDRRPVAAPVRRLETAARAEPPPAGDEGEGWEIE